MRRRRRTVGRARRMRSTGLTSVSGIVPTWVGERKRARSRGGHGRHGRSLTTSGADLVGLASVSDVVLMLEQTARDLLALENSVSRARAVAYVCATAIRALEVADLEARLARLEELVGVANEGV